MTAHPANALFHALNAMAAPLDALEAEARFKGWADNGRLFVIHRTDGSFVYQFGNAEISRREAALRVVGRAS
jgi:hypothetical protein